MKKTLALILFSVSLSLVAADLLVVVSPSVVQLNGSNVGGVASFSATNPQYAGQVQTALETWAANQTASVQAAQTAQALAESKLAALIAGAREAMAKPTTEERLSAAADLFNKAEDTVEEAKAAQIRADIAAKQAELATLEANPPR